MRILYIEDDIVDQKMLKRLVNRLSSVQLDITATIDEALVKSSAVLYDLILSDFYVVGDTAKEVLQKVTDTPIAVLSGVEDQTIVKHLYQLGAMQVLQKPVNKNQLHALIQKLLGRK